MRVFGICADSPESLKGLQETLGDAVTLLSDEGASGIERFGMLDESWTGYRKARVGSYHLDRTGVVRHRWLPNTTHDRPDPDEILKRLD